MNAIYEYIRKRKAGKVYKTGVIVAINDNDTIKIGWSKCNLKKDEFDPIQGKKFAIDRAVKVDNTPVPDCIKTQLRRFGARSVRYFKGAKQLLLP